MGKRKRQDRLHQKRMRREEVRAARLANRRTAQELDHRDKKFKVKLAFSIIALIAYIVITARSVLLVFTGTVIHLGFLPGDGAVNLGLLTTPPLVICAIVAQSITSRLAKRNTDAKLRKLPRA